MRTDHWATPVWEYDTSPDWIDRKKLLSELGNIHQGIGEFNVWNYVDVCPELARLKDNLLLLADSCITEDVPLRMERGWLNVQDKGQSLAPHNHYRVALVMCYYLQVPPNSGALWLLDPRGGVDWDNETYGNIDSVKGVRIEPKTGKIVIFPGYVVHYTEANTSDYRRISLATNVAKNFKNK